ncbi:hypothetical protein LTR36_006469 [Oleoguttula mirabilis]|uniref:Uncharacterized protein n=1 Tax=Oleoguttula mirabilis TaxID=1507867 RepID=A0AAV9JV99_9PEZI|nr:hypothetical protein LTR36_006469 [Oleoguttula mirabilis]
MASYTYELAELGDDAHGLGCKCCRFTKGIDLPIPAKLTIDEIKDFGLEFSTSIFSDWTALNAILKRYQATIQKRWLKKNTKQRREILLKAWPDMAVGHRPDFAGFRQTLKSAPRSRTCLSAAYLWPYINLEDLTHHHPLLLFLGARGRILPDKFMSADIEAAHLGRGWQFDISRPGDSMLFLGQCTPRSYGKVLSLVEAVPATRTKSIHRLDPRMGLLGLEIQVGIYRFLLSCARYILHDVEISQFCTAPHLPTPPPLERSKSAFRTLQDGALEAPYRAPQEFDLARLTQLVASRRSSAEDHIWMLREDPGYFIDALKEEREHDREYSHNCSGTWPNVAAKMISDALTFFLFWDDIHRRLEWMPPIDTQLKRANYKTMRLPSRYEKVWAELDDIVNLMLVIPTYRLTTGLPMSPRMRHCYPWHKKTNVLPKELWVFRPTRSEAERRVDMVFHAITDDDQRGMHALHHLVQEAQYMLDTEPPASQLVDTWLLGHFSDLALLSELKVRIDSLVPWSDSWRVCGVRESKTAAKNVGTLLRVDGVFREAFYTACTKTDTLGDPNSTHWRYPADKRPSKANVEQMRHAEGHLDDYWEEIDEKVRFNTTRDLMDILDARGLHLRTLHRTPRWKEPIILPAATTAQPLVALQALTLNNSLLQGLTDKVCTPKKAKIKTRGTPAPAPVATSRLVPATVMAVEPDPPLLAGVTVPKRAYKVLSAMLPPTGAEYHHCPEVAWDELLHTMNAIGLQPEKLYGSVWNFKPVSECKVELDLKRSIQFHEPKEVRRGSKIPPNMVRTFGRRLKHAFGWEAGMFECE